jgi:hypothetical protein
VRTISAAIEIGAAPMNVWAVLADLGRYHEWNPLIPAAAGEIAVGSRLTLRVVPGRGRPMTVRPKLVAAEPGVELRWIASLPGILSGEHSFVLNPVNGGTRLVQSEVYRGLLVAFTGKILAANEAGFRALNEALKRRVETPPSAPGGTG